MSSLRFTSLRCFLLQGIEAKEINLFLFDRFKCYLVVSDGQDSTAAPLFLSREEEINDKSLRVCVCVFSTVNMLYISNRHIGAMYTAIPLLHIFVEPLLNFHLQRNLLD